MFFFLFFFSTPDDPSEDHNIIEHLSILLPAPNNPQFQPALEVQVSPCYCKRNNGQPCHTFFDDVEVSRCRLQYIGKTRKELDLVLLAKIESCVHMSEETVRQKKQSVRERQRLIYRHKGFEICRNFFLHLHSIGEKKLKTLFKQYKENFAEANAIILPGRTPYVWKSDCKLLPTECSYRFVYGKNAETVDECGQKKISLKSFF